MRYWLGAVAACALTSAAHAQATPPVFHYSPNPWHRGGRIDLVRAEMHTRYSSGSCLRGTFISAAVTALEIPRVRVRPDAEFWFHNATANGWNGNPWYISRSGSRAMFRALPPALRARVLAGVGDTADFKVVYTGARLTREFGIPACV